MPYISLRYLFFSLVVCSVFATAQMKVSSYDANSAIKVSSSGSRVAPANVIATSQNKKLDVLGFWFVNTGLTYSDDVVVMRVAFNNFLFDSAEQGMAVRDINMLSDTAPGLQSDPLFYPNPFRFSSVNNQTGESGGVLYYQLSVAMNIEIHMYDIFGRRIWKEEIAANSRYGKAGENRIPFNKDALNGYEMSAGVYFYIFIYEGEVIHRGKVAVVP